MSQPIKANLNNNLKFDDLVKNNKSDNNTLEENTNESVINTNESLDPEATRKLQYFTE